MLKILQARLQQYMSHELPDVQTGFRKGRGTRDQIANIIWIINKAREFQKKKRKKNLLLYAKASEYIQFSSVQFSSVTHSCLTLCDPMNCSMPGFPVHHQFLEFAQTHVHRISDAIQPSHPLLSSFPLALNLSQHQHLFQRWLFTSGGQGIGGSASASDLLMNIQG